MKKLLTDYTLSELENIVTELGEKKFRKTQIFQAISLGKDFCDMTALSKEFRQKLQDGYDAVGVKILEKLVSRDGTEKYLYALRDGNVIEGVLMRYKYGNTLCVSTQVGCRMGCKFCASGIGGLVRNLSAGEIIGQVIAVNRDQGGNLDKREVTNIVLMGSGEPLDNYDNVLRFLSLCKDEYGISLRNISLSTSGLADKVKMLADSGLSVTLTISLHSPEDKTRENLMPVNKAFNISQIISSAKYYFEKTGRRVVFEYAMIKNVNDSIECAKKLASLVKGFPTHVNLIPLNYVKEQGALTPTGKERIEDFMKWLQDMGVSVTKRRTMGSDVAASCGQLRRKYLEENSN
ncbi:MAG: 23S rRNA (adenine(2503)-C(2))-methyltransferase RlmN [Clostridia bacterium]|nr:23S rRNA (adenine(2503)-C(2))-methyltransferase RlmN [Clostridia bacterium]